MRNALAPILLKSATVAGDKGVYDPCNEEVSVCRQVRMLMVDD